MTQPIPLDFNSVKDKLQVRNQTGKTEIWDFLRKKWVVLQPEEWVRQNMAHILVHHYGYSKHSIAMEKAITINGRIKRFDMLIYGADLTPHILVECKSVDIPLQQVVFDQLAVYNLHVKAPFLVATNGIMTYCFKQNHESRHLTFLDDIPAYEKKRPF